jgi:hypothetical protein
MMLILPCFATNRTSDKRAFRNLMFRNQNRAWKAQVEEGQKPVRHYGGCQRITATANSEGGRHVRNRSLLRCILDQIQRYKLGRLGHQSVVAESENSAGRVAERADCIAPSRKTE